MSLSLITDRTSTDTSRRATLRAKIKDCTATSAEWSEWLSPLKGAYNAADLNRVGSAIAYIADLLTGYGYAVDVSPKTDWALGDIPTPTQMEAYLRDVSALRAVLAVWATTPAVPGSMDNATYITANNIEKILVDVDALLTNIINTIDLGWALGIAHIGLYGGI